MKTRLDRARLSAILVAVVVLAAFGFYFARFHKVPIDRAVNPAFWIEHIRGLDRYDPQQALLQHGDPNVPEVAITIDDGPDPNFGPPIINYLHSAGVPATFFLVGKRVKQFPEVARLIAVDGFEIGDHTYDHQRLTLLKPHAIANELRFCAKDIKDVTGRDATLMRPPGVQYNHTVLSVAKALGFVTVSWTCGAADYDNQSASFIAKRVLDRTENGSIILLHQDHASTVGALPVIVQGLRARGYRFVTIPQMLNRLHAKLPVPPPS